jgi:hypothetical protein
MSTVRFPGRRKATVRALLAIAALVGFSLAASGHALSEGARIILTLAGYVGFVLFGSLALQAVRRDS